MDKEKMRELEVWESLKYGYTEKAPTKPVKPLRWEEKLTNAFRAAGEAVVGILFVGIMFLCLGYFGYAVLTGLPDMHLSLPVAVLIGACIIAAAISDKE